MDGDPIDEPEPEYLDPDDGDDSDAHVPTEVSEAFEVTEADKVGL